MKTGIVSINKKIQAGVPVVSGTRIPVKKVAYLNKKLKKSPAIIAVKYYTQLSVDQISEALLWYELNKGKYVGLDLR